MIALLAVAILSASPLPDGFQETKWGTSREAVLKSGAGEIKASTALAKKVTVAGEEAHAEYSFADGELGRVSVLLGPALEDKVRDLLTEKYGKPVTSKERTGSSAYSPTETVLTWTDGKNTIEHRTGGYFSRVVYYNNARIKRIRDVSSQETDAALAAEKAKALEGL